MYAQQKNLQKKGPGSIGQQKNFQKKGPRRAFVPKLNKISLPQWTKISLITSLTACWELKLKWVPKANKCYHIHVRRSSSNQCWFMNSGCSKHVTGKLKTSSLCQITSRWKCLIRQWYKGMFFCKFIIGKSMKYTIEDMYYVNGGSTIF